MSDCAIHTTNGITVSLETLANSSILALDVEGSGVHTGRDIPYGYSITTEPDSSFYASIHDAFFADLVMDDARVKLAHNAKFDRSMLKKAGITADNWYCTMVAAHLLEAPMLSLEFLNGWYLNRDNLTTYSDLPKPLETMNMQECADFSGPHSEATVLLWRYMYAGLKKFGLVHVFRDIEMPLIPVLSDMELNGIAVDTDYLNVLGDEFDRKLDVLGKGLDHWSGHPRMNHNSPQQVSKLLYDELNLPVGRATKTGDRPSVDKRYIETIKAMHPYIPMYLFYKELRTLKDSYVTSLGKQVLDGRIYGSFNQTRTSTGRLSSSDPNLQKIPTRTSVGKRIRRAFIAREGCKLLKVDYKLIELVMMAHQSQDQALLAAFRAGKDIHEETAIRAYGGAEFRPKGKTLNFKLIYLGGTKAEQKMLFELYPGVKKWTDDISLVLRENMYAKTLGGRIRTIDELNPDMSARVIAHGVREGISTMIQGSSAEEVKKGMARAHKQLRGSGAKGELQVHDEVVYEVPVNEINEVLEVIWREYPTNELSIPLNIDVEIGDNWGQMTKIKEGEKYGNS